MDRHVCPECGATVSGSEQFCPTCGAFLSDEEETGSEEYESFELGSAPPPPGPRPSTLICPSCGAENAPGNRHCEECGARLSQGPLPAAPRPAVQATAGVRAVVAIGGLLLAIIVIALLFQVFTGDDTPTTTTTAGASTTTAPVAITEPVILEPLDVQCSEEGLGSFACGNLSTGLDTLYQVNWPDLEDAAGTLTITYSFREAVTVSRIDWTNITNDDTRFRRNYRARSLTISADDAIVEQQRELENTPGTQSINFSSLETIRVVITVESVWDAELMEEQVFEELAIDEIEILGRAAIPTDATAPSTTGGATTTTGAIPTTTSGG